MVSKHPMAEAISNQTKSSHLRQVIADLALWCALVALLQVFRGVLLVWFFEQAAPATKLAQFLRCFSTGLRFDASVSSYVVLPLAVFGIVGLWKQFGSWHQRVRSVLIGLVSVVWLAVFVIDIAYFQEYGNQFNHWVFQLGYDDRGAIGDTIWKSYPVVWLVLGILVAGPAMAWLIRKWTRYASDRIGPSVALTGGWRKAVLAGLMMLALFLGMRGSLGHSPARFKDAAACGDVFLDKIALNPFSAFRYAWAQQRQLTQAPGLESILPGGDIRKAAQAVCSAPPEHGSLDECFRRTAVGSRTEKPRHIFLIVMEGYDSWPMQPEFRPLHLADQLQELGRKGIQADAFVSASPWTVGSLFTLITGLPELNLHANYRTSIRDGLPTSIAPIFKRLGYRTRFFYGGYLSWQRLGEFCREQGFDEVHGNLRTGNAWGVEDRALFDDILNSPGEKPTFSMVMTTSYHPPFSINVAAEGFPFQTLPSELQQYKVSSEELRRLGHLWYADRCLGRFIEEAARNWPRSLFAITGDHYSRRCINPRPTLYQRKAVPFVLYGPEVLSAIRPPDRMAGSHLDILPTLVELAAPPGFAYHALGRNMLDASQTQTGFGHGLLLPGFPPAAACPAVATDAPSPK